MRAFHSPASLGHDPTRYFRRGAWFDHPERAERYRLMLAALEEGGHAICAARDLGMGPIAAVHDGDYLSFLRTAWSRRDEMGANVEELVTSQFANSRMNARSGKLINQLGFHTADTSTPIRGDTWDAVYGAAQAAAEAALAALEDGCAYALSRPPGHHAYADCAGGFCYLNNTAIAARSMFERTGERVAVLDVDVHHGNGTQGIFYESGDVLTVSVHAETSGYFPLYSGYADETGSGAGTGANLNLPLEHGAGDEAVLAAVEAGLQRIRAHSPASLVVALGFDAAADDPMGVFNVTPEGFSRIAGAIAQLELPSALVQEGGYAGAGLKACMKSFLDGFEAARRA